MTASFRYVARNLGRRRTRTLLGALGIFLTLSLLTAIQIGIDSISVSPDSFLAVKQVVSKAEQDFKKSA